MSGSKFVIDTNVIFMSLYNPEGKAGKIIQLAIENKFELFSTDSVKEELIRVLKREMSFSNEEISSILSSLPIKWIEKEVYKEFMNKVKVKHKPDKPVEALSLVLNCGILSADRDFKNRLNVDNVLKKFS